MDFVFLVNKNSFESANISHVLRSNCVILYSTKWLIPFDGHSDYQFGRTKHIYCHFKYPIWINYLESCVFVLASLRLSRWCWLNWDTQIWAVGHPLPECLFNEKQYSLRNKKIRHSHLLIKFPAHVRKFLFFFET